MSPIPIVDLFAGPGGLGEGFASLRGRSGEPNFDIRLSIEKDLSAHRTLQLRSFFRSFQGDVPRDYYDYVRGQISREALFLNSNFFRNRKRATEETCCLELCEKNHEVVKQRVKETLRKEQEWV